MAQATAQVSRTLDAPADKVWDALVHPEARSFFMGAEVQSDFRVGSPIRFKGEYKGKAYEDRGEILEAEPSRRLSFSHYSPMSGAPDAPENYHVVTFELQPDKDMTRVTLTQSNLKGGVKDADVQHRAEYEKTWAAVLDSLSQAATH
jgi:uncharacterized protein YndB with AHSA1/START domain